MARNARIGIAAALTATFLGFAAAAPSLPVAYCASSNTGDSAVFNSIYQTEGLCHDHCNPQGYALAVVQGLDCWCSNEVPGDVVDVSECNAPCPGYPTDYCGGDGLYGYLALDAAPKGTAGGSTTAKSTTKPTTTSDSVTTTSSSATPSSTSSIVLTSDKSSKTVPPTTTPDPMPETTEAPKPTIDKNSGGTPTTITAIHTVTSEGSIVIQTITTVSSPSAKQPNGNGLTKGAVAGLTIGILAAVGAFVMGAFLLHRHNRRRQSEEAMAAAGMGNRRGSSAGIMSKTGTISSSGFGMAMEEDGSYSSNGRRMSMKPMDPRLDPKVGLYRIASHDSLNTIRDDQDYSRRVHDSPRIMRVTNPDPNTDD